MDYLILDILLKIFGRLNLPNQLSFRSTSKYFQEKCQITNLSHDENTYKLNNKILTQYPHIIQLDADNNPKIRDISSMTQLMTLHCRGRSGINNDSLLHLTNLTSLYFSNNYKIYDINHLTKLQQLDIRGNCKINGNGISFLTNLQRLSVVDNIVINDINLFTNLI